MDRVAFLRSLKFLRPVHPSQWDSCNDIDGNNGEEEPYSGSTVTPPTPSKNNRIMVFEQSLFLASVETNKRPCERSSGNRNVLLSGSRKRERENDYSHAANGEGLSEPVFFHNHGRNHALAKKSAETVMEHVNESEPDNLQQNKDVAESDIRIQMDSDPSLCTFEAAILMNFHSAKHGDLDGERLLSTPTGSLNASSHEMDKAISNALIFRFGHHFVFQVDKAAILDVKYVPGRYDSNPRTMSYEKQSSPPPSKRQRNEEKCSLHAEGASLPAEIKKIPPSLLIFFDSCTFRVFSMEYEKNSGIGGIIHSGLNSSDRVWGTLSKSAESLESRLMKARSILVQHCDIEEEGRKSCEVTDPSWKMGPPGSGVAFHTLPAFYESSSFHSSTLKYKVSNFLEHDWDYCLGNNSSNECITGASSPQKSSSPSKTSSSSTHFEHGQEENAPSIQNKDGLHSAENENEEKNNCSNDSSELTFESKQHRDAEKTGQSSPLKLPGSHGKCLEVVDKEHVAENQKSGCQSGEYSICGPDAGGEGIDTKNQISAKSESAKMQAQKIELYNKFYRFEASANHMERAMEPPRVLSKHQRSMPHLILCAKFLSESYLTANEFVQTSQECENEIEDATSEMESTLDCMFPARGRKSNDVSSDQSEDHQRRIEELMQLRKRSVAAKLALLMTPKR